MNLLRKKAINYNKILDLISQIDITLMNEFAPAQITEKVHELKALIYYELRIINADLIEQKANNDFISQNIPERK